MNKNTITDYVKEIMQKSGKKLLVHNCSFCNYPCGYIYINNILFYDSGCNCVDEKIMETRKEEELTNWIKNNLI